MKTETPQTLIPHNKRTKKKKKKGKINLENPDRKEEYLTITRIKVETKRINKSSPNNLTDNITELNELIYPGWKIACNKISAFLWNMNRNTKPGWEIGLERHVMNVRY